jgi:hypothetical protein
MVVESVFDDDGNVASGRFHFLLEQERLRFGRNYFIGVAAQYQYRIFSCAKENP